jgi:hypothetical protein
MDATNSRATKTEVSVYDIPSHTRLQQFPRPDVLPPSGSLFLGCSIASVTTTGPKECTRENRFELKNEVVIRAAAGQGIAYKDMGAVFANDIAACVRSCSGPAPDGHCLALGKSAAGLVVPLLPLIDSASQSDQVIAKTEIMKKYNLSASDDKCERGDVQVKGGIITNSAKDSCTISLSSYSSVVLPANITMFLPGEVKAQALSGIQSTSSALSKSPQLRFDLDASPPQMLFKSQDNMTDLTNTFGGFIQAAQKIDDTVVLATSNGCVSVDLK